MNRERTESTHQLVVKAATTTPPPGAAARWLWKSSVPVTAARAAPPGVPGSLAKEPASDMVDRLRSDIVRIGALK